MIIKTEGLVLKCFPYSDTSLIAKVFTRQQGLVSFLIPGGRNSKNRTGNLLQPTHLVAFEMYWREQRNFQKLNDCRALTIYKSLFTDFSRKAIALFICEILAASLPEKEQNEELFNFVLYSMQELDEAEHIPAIYPSVFLLSMSNVLGFYPSTIMPEESTYFDMENGAFVSSGTHLLDKGTSASLKQLLEAHSSGNSYLPVSSEKRADLLHGLLDYYRWHVPGFKQVRSPELLHLLLA